MESYQIERLGHQGDGIAAGPVFAARTLPGETVTGSLDGTRLSEVRIETPSEHRVQPPCRHYKSCGGCQLQHASGDFVAEWKVQTVGIALSAQGLETDLRPIKTSPPRSRRRATLAVRRTKKGALVGFHGRASDTIIEIPECQLLMPELLGATPVCERLAALGASRKTALAVTVTASGGGLDLSVTGGKPLDGPLESALAQLIEQTGLARLAWNGEVVAMRQAPTQAFGKATVTPPAGGFLQATREGEAALLDAVRETVGSARRIADLFAGCGTFSLPLAEQSQVHAVEGDAGMTDALDRSWRFTEGLKKVTTETRDLFRRPLLQDELASFEAVVLDPPRAGADAQVAELVQAKVPVIAYVSCNPVTFARDAKTLTDAGYCLNWVQVVDQFRWSAHVELAASFTLTHMTKD